MADLETRVAMLEREMTDPKARVADHDADLQNIPDLIKSEARLTNSQIARLSRDVAELKRGVAELERGMDALPRAIAEIVKEMLEAKR